jgi:hypothetical protein
MSHADDPRLESLLESELTYLSEHESHRFLRSLHIPPQQKPILSRLLEAYAFRVVDAHAHCLARRAQELAFEQQETRRAPRVGVPWYSRLLAWL